MVIVLLAGLFPAAAGGGLSSIRADELRVWLTDVSSDRMQGRAIYSAGLGLTAAYLEQHLREWDIKPGGDSSTAPGAGPSTALGAGHHSYFQTVRVQGVRTTSRSTVTLQVGRQTRTFKDGEGVTLPRFQGGNRSVTASRVELVGYGLDAPAARQMDYGGKDVKDAVVVYLGNNGPKGVDSTYRQILSGRSRYATEQQGAIASIDAATPTGEASGGRGGGQAGTGGRSAAANVPVDFTTARRLDQPIAPDISGSDEFLTFLFSRAPVGYAELKRKAAAQEPLPSFRLNDVTIKVDIDVDYEIVRTQLTHNVVAIVEGSDPRLKDTYVAIGAHYDHIGYADRAAAPGNERPPGAPGRVTAGTGADHIWNGADDNGSGTVALMALARAFREGPPPKRSLIFVWHTGEEAGLYGSRYFADYPPVPIDAIVAQLNIDMVGRNRNDDHSQSNTVYLVGSDRISSELHEISRAANSSLPQPLTLDYELNDPSDPEQLYYRSDHYSYAAKGIPVIFFTTGLHPDYHANTDEVSKIEFDKLTRIAGLIYETGARLANLDHAPARDRRGARAGRGTP
jgi:hypothetical protein